MKEELELVACFHASLPMIQSACSLGGDGSTRIKLDVPASERMEVMRLMELGLEEDLIITVHRGKRRE